MDAPNAQAAAAEETPSGEAASSQDPKQLIIGVNTGLAQILQAAQSAGAPDQIVSDLQTSLQAFRSAMDAMVNGGGSKAPADSGTASPEAGGNKNAMPMA
jgi:hypothetical protein